MPMKHQIPIRRSRRVCLCALLLALLLFAGSACAPGGDTSTASSKSDPEPVSSEPASEILSAPEESLPAESSPAESLPIESSEPEVTTLPEVSDPGDDPSEPPTQEVFGDTFCYVALGDSICRGYGLKDPETQRYSSLIGKQTGCTVYNYGVDGQTEAQLIDFLRNGKAEALAKADVVSVSIGGNNLLHVLSSLLLSLVGKFDPKDPGAALQVDAEDLFAAVDDAIAAFEQQLPELIDLIGEQTPNAKILFQTVYNPYRSFTLLPLRLNGRTMTLSALANECVYRLNEIIRDGALQYGYTVCDVYDAFEQNADQLVNASLSKINFDPHPNAEGHAVIAEVLLKEMPIRN